MTRFLALLVLAFATRALAADGFLFVTFKGEQTPLSEQVYFALSKDGRHWTALNSGEPVLVSKIGEKGVRDPYLIRSPEGRKFYLIATDLCINRNGDWTRAQRAGSKSIVVWESDDLAQWGEPRLVKVAPDDAGCTWAPEAIYDESSQRYLVFWASRTGRDNFAKQRIWATWTADFRTFSEPFTYIDKAHDVIDTTIIREGDKFYRFSKDEQFKAITMEASGKLMGPWEDVPDFSLGKMKGYEGPECYPVEAARDGKPATWCLILDHYREGRGYQPFISQDLSKGQFNAGEGFTFPFRLRHGSVLPLSGQEYRRLESAYSKRTDQ